MNMFLQIAVDTLLQAEKAKPSITGVIEEWPKEFFFYATTSLVGAVVALILGFFWKEKVYPYLMEITDGYRIHPEWRGTITLDETKVWTAHLTISKSGKNISGELALLSGESEGKRYSIKGRYHGRIITFIYEPAEENTLSIAQGTATFVLTNDGKKLDGYFAFASDKYTVGPAESSFTPN